MASGIEIFDQTLAKKVFGNTVEDWLIALTLFLLVWAGLAIFKKIVVKRLADWAKRSKTTVDDFFVGLLKGAHPFLLFVVALWFAVGGLVIPDRLGLLLHWVLTISIFVQIGIWANALVTFLLDRRVRAQTGLNSSTKSALGVMNFFIQAILWSLVLLLALDNLGVNITALIAGLGVGSIAIALAMQNILGDIFCSISILLDKPFEVDDAITVGEFSGVVEAIGIKSTKIRSTTGEQIIISNADLLGSRIRNHRRLEQRRISFLVKVAYSTSVHDLEKIPELIKKIVEAVPDTRFDRAHLRNFGDFALVYEVVYFILKSDYLLYMDAQQKINLAVLRAFQELDVKFAISPPPPAVVT